MKSLAVLASAVALIGMATPAHADGNDDAFFAALKQAGISYKSPDRAIKAAQKVCDLAEAGTSNIDIVRDLHDLNPGFSMQDSIAFARAAAGAYCPDRLPPAGSG